MSSRAEAERQAKAINAYWASRGVEAKAVVIGSHGGWFVRSRFSAPEKEAPKQQRAPRRKPAPAPAKARPGRPERPPSAPAILVLKTLRRGGDWRCPAPLMRECRLNEAEFADAVKALLTARLIETGPGKTRAGRRLRARTPEPAQRTDHG